MYPRFELSLRNVKGIFKILMGLGRENWGPSVKRPLREGENDCVFLQGHLEDKFRPFHNSYCHVPLAQVFTSQGNKGKGHHTSKVSARREPPCALEDGSTEAKLI